MYQGRVVVRQAPEPLAGSNAEQQLLPAQICQSPAQTMMQSMNLEMYHDALYMATALH